MPAPTCRRMHLMGDGRAEGGVGVASPPPRLIWPPGHVSYSHGLGVSPAPSLCGGAWQVYVSAGASSRPPSRHRNPLTLGASLGGTAQVSRGWGIHTIPFISPRSEIPSRLIEGSFQFLLPVGRSNKFWQYFVRTFVGLPCCGNPANVRFQTKSTPFIVLELGSSGNGRPLRSWSLE